MFSKKIDRFKLLLIAELIMALLLFFTCFQKETKVFTIFGDGLPQDIVLYYFNNCKWVNRNFQNDYYKRICFGVISRFCTFSK